MDIQGWQRLLDVKLARPWSYHDMNNNNAGCVNFQQLQRYAMIFLLMMGLDCVIDWTKIVKDMEKVSRKI